MGVHRRIIGICTELGMLSCSPGSCWGFAVCSRLLFGVKLGFYYYIEKVRDFLPEHQLSQEGTGFYLTSGTVSCVDQDRPSTLLLMKDD